MAKRKTFLIIVLVSVSILVLLAASLAAVFFLIPPENLLKLASGPVQKQYSLQFSAEKTGFHPLRGLELNNFTLKDSETGRTLLTASRVEVWYNPLGLLRGRLEIMFASLNGASFSLDLVETVQKRFLTNSSTNQKASPLSLGTVSWENLEFRARQELFKSRGSFTPHSPFLKSSVRGEVLWRGAKITIEGMLEEARASLDTLALKKVNSSLPDITIRNLGGQVRLLSNSVRIVAEESQFILLDWRLSTDKTWAGEYDFQNGELRLQNLDLKTGQTRLLLPKLNYRFQNSIFQLSATFTNLNLSDLLASAGGQATGFAELKYDQTLSLKGQATLEHGSLGIISNLRGIVQAGGRSLEVDLEADMLQTRWKAKALTDDFTRSQYRVRLQTDSLDLGAQKSPAQKNDQNTNATLSALLARLPLNAEVDCTVGRVIYGRLALDSVMVRASVGPGSLSIPDFSARLYRGILRGQADYADKRIQGKAEWKEGRLKDAGEVFLGSERRLYGTASAKLNFSLPLDAFQKASIQADWEIRKGEIQNFFGQKGISEVLYNMPLDNLFFDRVKGQFEWKDGQAAMNGFLFESQPLLAEGEGKAVTATKELSAAMKLSFTEEFLEGLPNVAQLFTAGYRDNGRVVFRLRMDGAWTNPSVKLEKN